MLCAIDSFLQDLISLANNFQKIDNDISLSFKNLKKVISKFETINYQNLARDLIKECEIACEGIQLFSGYTINRSNPSSPIDYCIDRILKPMHSNFLQLVKIKFIR